MPDATITSTASTFGTISGVFSADQSTISGTISGIVPGTLTGSVGVPGPAGPGVPAGGTAGQYLQKTSGVDYATDWVTVNLTGLATESWVTAGFYPLTGNPSSFLTASALTPYLTSATAASTYQTLSGMSSYLTTSAAASTYQTLSGMSDYLAKAGNLAGLANTGTARTNLGLGSLAVVNDAPSDGSQYARKNGAWDVVTTTPDYITSVSSPLSVTSGNLTIDLSAYAPLASPAFTGNPTAPTATFGDNDTSLATTAFVQSALAGGTAVARDLEVEVRNQSGSTIAAGSIVYISGATGNKPLITLAQANNDANSAQTIGFVKTAIANNGTGYVIVRGELENIDTSALTEGVQLYLSPTTAGTWTTTKPSAPQHLVYVGIVIRSHPTLGVILVAVQNGYELNELHDVAIGTLANNNLLAYESSTDLWKNKTYSALGLLTSADAASTYYLQTNPAGYQTAAQVTTALSPYLTSATAATTYATILEPSVDGILTVEPSGINTATVNVNQDANNYIHLRAGAGQISMVVGGSTRWFFNDTYLQFPGGTQQTVAYPGPSGFLLKADNLSGLANTGTARTNLGLGTMAVETASNYLTTATASSTYFTIASAANKADLASPTFTGTPTLPTGTIATTQSPGNNTTALATTAFVTAAVPAFATAAQARGFTSTTTAINPRQLIWAMLSQDVVYVNRQQFTFTNVGTITYINSGSIGTTTRPGNAGACSSRGRIFGFSQVDQTDNQEVKTNPKQHSNYSLRKIFSGRSRCEIITDANFTWAWYHGKAEADGVGDLVRRGFGWKMIGGAGSRFLLLQVHNGTTLTSVTSSYAVTANISFDWDVESDGSGNVTLYVNGTSVATSSAGPTGSVSLIPTIWQEEMQAAAALASAFNDTAHSRGRYIVISP
jgi:hypothetical protein